MDSIYLCDCKDRLAMAAVPNQEWCDPYDYATALEEGTIFPCLNLPFHKAPFGKCKQKSSGRLLDPLQESREEMMAQLAAVSFAINDLTLYLDTHPDCPKGTALFYQLLKERLNLLTSFAEKFYPLTQTSMVTGDYNQNQYGWGDGPMPWEGACI